MTFRFPEDRSDNVTCVRGGLRWNRKDCFSADYVTLVDNGDWVERNYTTASGNTVLILRSPSQEQGYILCDREEALMTLWLDVNPEVYSEVGGAPLMGVRGTVIKAHGNSDAKAIKNAIGQAVKFTETGVVDKISASLSE